MKIALDSRFIAAFLCLPLSVIADNAFFGDAPDANHPWAVHDQNRPQPPRVEPGVKIGDAPSDALVLFDGTTESFQRNWQHVKPKGKRKSDWTSQAGYMLGVGGAGYIETQAEFGDCQLHIEWSHEKQLPGDSQKRGNSGVFLPGGIEVQVLDNYNNPSYADGMAGAVYGVMPPAANALRAPGQWQSYDIIFRRPIVKDGVVLDEGSMTVLVNGVVVQDSTPLDGGGGFKKRKPLTKAYPEQGRIQLQDHGNPVRYRNVWVRPLRPRPADGGTDGRLSAEATVAKRAEIAAEVRASAADLDGYDRMMRLLEAYMYDNDPAAWSECDALVTAYVSGLQSLSSDDLKKQRNPVTGLRNALTFLQRFSMIPKAYAPEQELKSIAGKQGWLKKKR
ncbi:MULTISPECIES: DUF1080 domain-containing protein [unclassified Lentimonas]|uniref:3-keto-disaccharide hydrolase n=1 Tax=unclassified Lentimonas TaxID=2630993 RepID=UPI00132577CC|nr:MULTISPECIES: DUF1080 domain-containing protein [unclassified Lentimonas]CAA6678575.1 putative multi-domain protein [Lentimonas sp. CC4]CAA6685807.1 putative multi-domain protein [Lentimonas sp. CC6]CAA7076281.1 putative multi-domain protein [Lentimonas sp. CC4]CAA7171947.1 putative multi-domain protein [Lentimonas sp. CC21]CAA7181535.1 putative multi-domain protein [Lentimonas sp. CC8]